jgi:hypothetical protein
MNRSRRARRPGSVGFYGEHGRAIANEALATSAIVAALVRDGAAGEFSAMTLTRVCNRTRIHWELVIRLAPKIRGAGFAVIATTRDGARAFFLGHSEHVRRQADVLREQRDAIEAQAVRLDEFADELKAGESAVDWLKRGGAGERRGMKS